VPPVSVSAMDTSSEPPAASDCVMDDTSPTSNCVPVRSAPAPGPVLSVPVTVSAPPLRPLLLFLLPFLLLPLSGILLVP